MEKIEEWEAMSGMDFARNCVFIYEGRIHSAYTATLWSLSKRHPTKSVLPTAKGITITILGSISQVVVIDILLKKPQAVSTFKKREANDTTATAINGRVGASFWHIYPM